MIRRTRRTFLKSSTFSLIGAGIAPLVFFSGKPARSGQGEHSKARFEALLNHWFYVDADHHPTLELVQVVEGPQALGFEQFTAVFRAPLDNDLGDSIHLLTTPADTPMELHLSPGKVTPLGQNFAAQFCLQLPLGHYACAPVTPV